MFKKPFLRKIRIKWHGIWISYHETALDIIDENIICRQKMKDSSYHQKMIDKHNSKLMRLISWDDVKTKE